MLPQLIFGPTGERPKEIPHTEETTPKASSSSYQRSLAT